MTEFEIFALDHKRHNHCQGCGGCLLDPAFWVQGFNAWCVGCARRIKSNLPPGARPPWGEAWELGLLANANVPGDPT